MHLPSAFLIVINYRYTGVLNTRPSSSTHHGFLRMKTLDITEVHNGLVIVHGFGDKYWDTAVYVDGTIVGQSREGFDDDQVSTNLSKHLAQKMGLAWEERATHIWWRRSFHSQAPATLAEYDAKTVEGYQTADEDDFVEFVVNRIQVPRRAEDERYIAVLSYELSGGDCEQFDVWYETWLSENQSFNEKHRKEVDARLLLEARYREMPDDSLLPEIGQHTSELKALFVAYMREFYCTTKPLDPVAQRAKS
jgi:hypothetical protein